LLRLDLLPPRSHLTGRIERRLAFVTLEHVRMPPHEFVPDALHRVRDSEVSCFRFELREKYRLEHVVAELLAERPVIVAIDRLEHLIRLLEPERLQRVDRLLAIPRAPVGPSKRGHDLDEPGELAGGVRTMGHLTIVCL